MGDPKASPRARPRAGRDARPRGRRRRRPRPRGGGEPLRDRPSHLPLGRLGGTPDPAAADARPRVRRHRRRCRAQRAPRRRRATTSRPRATSPAACASTAARDRRTCASRPRSSGSTATARSPSTWPCPESVIWLNDRTKLPPEIATLQEPFGNAVFATSLHDLAGRTVAILGCGPGRPVQHRDRASLRRRTRPRVGPRRVSARARANDGRRPTSSTWTMSPTCPSWFLESERGRAPRRRLRDVRRAERDRGRVQDRPQRRTRGPLRHPCAAGRARRRGVAHLQEPDRHRRERAAGLRVPGTAPAGSSSTASSTCGR